MNTRSDNRPAGLLLGLGLLAMLTGLVVSMLEPKWVFAGMLAAVAVCLVFYDYRVGAICLTLVLPWTSSPLLPQARGFDVVNFLILASAASFALRRFFSKELSVALPAVVRWCYLLPFALGALVAWPHLPEGLRNFPPQMLGDVSRFSGIGEFLKSAVVKPLFFVVYAFLIANAARDSKKPERLIVAFGLSAVLPAVAIIVDFMAGGGDVADRATHLAELGMHANTYGMLLALTAGPLLFVAVGSGSLAARLASAVALCVVTIGLVLTGSRGAALSYVVVLLTLLLRRRKFTDLLFCVVLVAVLSLAVPDTVWNRLALGLDEAGATGINTKDDPLTKGRVSSWLLLAPDILLSPLWGQGIGSVAWNVATTAGHYGATLAHNMYLDILLDLGILGFAGMMYLYYRYARTFSSLSSESSIAPALRDFFAGAFASFLGMLCMAMTNGFWIPHPEQTFLWFALGLSFAYWKLASDSAMPVEAKHKAKLRILMPAKKRPTVQ